MHLKGLQVYFLVFAFTSSLMLYGCNEPKLKSKWCDNPVTIDGIDKEWEDCPIYYDEDTRTMIGIFNDKRDMYIRFATSDRQLQRQIIGQGLTVWFDPKGGKNKHLGIFYPTGIMDRKMLRNDAFDSDTGTRTIHAPAEYGHMSDRRFRDQPDQNPTILLDEMMDDMPHVIDIKIPDGIGGWDTIFLDEKDNKGIQAKARPVQGRLVYELKIPLTKNDETPYGLNVSKRGKIGIGFETTKMDMNKMRGKMGNDRRRPDGGIDGPRGRGSDRGGRGGPGRKGGDRGGMDGPRGGKRDAFKNRPSESLELWVIVELASKP